jgi:hypothetical protein
MESADFLRVQRAVAQNDRAVERKSTYVRQHEGKLLFKDEDGEYFLAWCTNGLVIDENPDVEERSS